MQINRDDMFAKAANKFINTDKEFVEKVSNPLYSGNLDKNVQVSMIIDHRVKLLTGLVIFLLDELSKREQESNKTKSLIQL